jgi:hypothetical protein
MSDNTPGWQPDPTGQHDHRYWDGTQWTEHVADAGVAGIDPLESEAPWARAEPEVPAEPEAPADLDEPTVIDQEAAAPDATADYPATVEQPAAWPTDPAAPDTPAPPPPYVPTEPTGDGGSKKGLLIGGGILAAVVLAVVAFMALGGDDDEPSVQAQLASKLEEEADGELTSDQADCVAGLVVDEVGEDALQDVDFDAAEAPDEVLNAFMAIGLQTMAEECNIDETTLTGVEGTTDDTTGGSDLPADFEQNLADLYESTLGLSSDQAECLANKLAEVVEEGTLNEEQAASEFMNYLSDCDISLDDIDTN